MSSRRLVQILTVVILILLGGIGYLIFLLGDDSAPARPVTKVVTNT